MIRNEYWNKLEIYNNINNKYKALLFDVIQSAVN